MADNTVLPGTGETYAADDIDGVKYQRVKIALGEPGTAIDSSTSTPLPVSEITLAALLDEVREIRFLLSAVLGG